MSAGDLTSLFAVKQWLEIDPENTDADVLLKRLIRAASAFVLQHLNRKSLTLTEYVETYDGYGNSFMLLRQAPVYDLSALSFTGTPISSATGDGFTSPRANGFVLEPPYSPSVILGEQRVNLYGYRFPRQRAAVSVRYRAGYVIDDEPHTIADVSPATVSTDSMWLGDVSVKNAETLALFVLVKANPTVGQYTVDGNGVYGFNDGDIGLDILISYSFVPADIEQAVWELVGERYRYMDRIGYVSKSLGGQETVTFSQRAISDYVTVDLAPYKNVVPV